MPYHKMINEKIINDYKGKDLENKLKTWRNQGKSIVFTNGCFDILHLGHIDYLVKAASLGDRLIIGLNTDNSVRKIKGENRPVNNQHARSMMLASLLFTDMVVFFDEETPYSLIKTILPDVLVKGGDYKREEIVGYDILVTYGGKIKTIDFLEGYSTTTLIEKINKISYKNNI